MKEQLSTNGRRDQGEDRVARRNDLERTSHRREQGGEEQDSRRRLSLTERERIERWPIG